MRHNLSDTTDLIRDRRSIAPERFSGRCVHRELVEHILSNATWAPTHGMTQPWRFTVYLGEGMKRMGEKMPHWYKAQAGNAFSQGKFDKLKKRGETVTAMVVVGMIPDPKGRIREIEEIEAVACSVQNMFLTCTAYGLGAFWSSPDFMYSDEFRDYVGFPEGGKVLGMFYIGYPEGEWPQAHRKPLEYVTRWEEEREPGVDVHGPFPER